VAALQHLCIAHLQAPLHRQQARFDRLPPGAEVALVLGEQLGELADRRGADAQQLQLAAGGVALEVAVQPPLPRRQRQAVAG